MRVFSHRGEIDGLWHPLREEGEVNDSVMHSVAWRD